MSRYDNVKPCPVCGRKNWQYEKKEEPIDKSGIWTYETKEVEYRVCPCGYKERIKY